MPACQTAVKRHTHCGMSALLSYAVGADNRKLHTRVLQQCWLIQPGHVIGHIAVVCHACHIVPAVLWVQMMQRGL